MMLMHDDGWSNRTPANAIRNSLQVRCNITVLRKSHISPGHIEGNGFSVNTYLGIEDRLEASGRSNGFLYV